MPRSSGGGGSADSVEDGASEGGDGGAAAASTEHLVLEMNSRSVGSSLDQPSFEELGQTIGDSAEEVSVLGVPVGCRQVRVECAHCYAWP